MAGYRNKKSKNGSLSLCVKNVELANKIRHHCRKLNVTPSDWAVEWLEKGLENAREQYLQRLTKEELIHLIMEKE